MKGISLKTKRCVVWVEIFTHVVLYLSIISSRIYNYVSSIQRPYLDDRKPFSSISIQHKPQFKKEKILIFDKNKEN